jgi:2-isopropylmalate synthase
MTTEIATDQEPQDARSSELRLVRWSCASGSNMQSRGSVVIQGGDHRWEGSAKGTGPVDALFRAVDSALHEVLTGHPRLVAYDVHAVAEGPDAAGRVEVRIAPPGGAVGERANGTYEAVAEGVNIIAASVEAYVDAIGRLLSEEHWQGATDAAGNDRAARRDVAARAEFDSEVAPDTSRWWDS